MKHLRVLLLVNCIPLFMLAQETNSLTGEYYLRGVMETASGFRLNADSTFEFFFSYGALDRYGKGKWAIKDKRIVFNSPTKPAHDFTLRAGKTVPGKTVTIKMVDINPALVSYIDCRIKSNGKALAEPVSREGTVTFPVNEADTIMLQLQFCPEKISTFTITDKKQNYFEFGIEQWIFEYFFDNFMLAIGKDELTGKHPLLTGNEYRFVREKN